jgi:hypothetical protein
MRANIGGDSSHGLRKSVTVSEPPRHIARHAAWPAASLVGSYGLLLWLIRTAAAGAVASEPDAGLAGRPADHPVVALRLVPMPTPGASVHRGRAGRLRFSGWPAKSTAWSRSQERAGPASQGPLEHGRSTGTRTG